MQTILKKIQNDEVNDAYCEIQKKEESQAFCLNGYSALISLNKLVMVSLKNKTSCKSDCKDIYNVAELCCDDETQWEMDQTGCMQCLYHIVWYFLRQGEPLLAKKLCGQFFLHCKKRKNEEWEEKETLVLKNTLTHFIYYLLDGNKVLITDSNSEPNSVVSWVSFALKINEFNDFTNTSDFFKWCYSFTKKFYSKPNIVRDVIKQFSLHLRKIISKKEHNWKPSSEIIVYSTDILSLLCQDINYFDSSCCLTFIEFIKCLRIIVTSHPLKNISIDDIGLLEVTFNLFCAEKEGNFESAFECFFEAIQMKDMFPVEILPLIFHCLTTLRTKISKCLSVENYNVVKMVKIIFAMFSQLKPKQLTDDKRGHDLLHAFTAAIYFMWNAKLDPESLKELCKIVRMLFQGLNYLVKNLSKGNTLFDCGAPYCVNIIQSYKDAELYPEMATLSRDMIKHILLMNSKHLPVEKYKVTFEHLLNLFVTSYGKINLPTDAQMGLLAFAGVHPQYTTYVFKYWAELKVNFSPQFNLEKGSITCYDVISTSKSSLEENWPPFLVESINIETFLLEEMKAYAKHRELQIGPALAVYRTSFKLITDKIILAQMLTAAVDCVATDEFNSSLHNLQLSLTNILGSLTRLKAQTTDKRKLCHINCLISGVLYQQIRIEISQARKKAEDELELLYIPAKEDVPVIEGEETRNITPAYSHLVLKHHTLAEKLVNVLNSWSSAADLATLEDEEFFSFRYLKCLAYILRLYDFKTQEVDTWKLIYSLSKKFSNTKYKILAVSELLGLTSLVDSSWIRDAEEAINRDESIKKSFVYPLYLTNRVKCCYLNKNYIEATKFLKEVDDVPIKKFYLVNARHKMLILLLKICNFESISDKSETVLLSMIKYFEHILYAVKMKTWHTFSEKCVLQWLLLEVSLFLGRTYLDLRIMRHAMYYAKKQLAAAQALALPVKVCEFLSILCSADLLTGNTEEAREKLNGLDTILGLDHISLADSDNSDFGIYSNTTSKSDIKKPEFLTHDGNCDCLECSNIVILTVILNSFRLKTLYTSSAGTKDLAQHTASIVKDIIDHINKKMEMAPQGYYDSFNESKVRFYITLSYCCAGWGELESAEDYNHIADKVLSTTGPRNTLLAREVSFQRQTLDWLSYIPPKTVTYAPKLYAKDKVPTEIIKTPEPVKPLNLLAKHLKRAISPSTGKIPITPQPLHARKLLLDAFNKELDGNYTADDKENAESPKIKNSSKVMSERSPLAKVLPQSPKLAFKKNILKDESGNSSNLTPKTNEWLFETPKPREEISKTTKSRKTRLAQTEKKGKKLFDGNLFSTPFQSHNKPEIKIFCDEDDMEPITTTSTRRKKATTTKKTIPKSVKKPVSTAKSGRKLSFDSDSEEDAKGKKEARERHQSHSQLGRCLFQEEEAGPAREKSSLSEESSIIECSFLETSESSLCLPLTPHGLEDSMKRLAISGRKLAPLSTRKMARLPDLSATPTSTSLQTRNSSRLNNKTTRK